MAPLPWRCAVDTDATRAAAPSQQAAAAAMPAELHVFHGTTPALLCRLDIEPDWDVDDLKQAICDSQGIPKPEQRLFANERMLQNQEELREVFASGGDAVKLQRFDPALTEQYDSLCSGALRLSEASEGLRSDRWSVLAAVQRKGTDLRYAADALRDDREIVLEAVQNDGLAIRHAAEQWKSNREIVLAAVTRNGFVLELVSDELRADKEVVCAAVQKDGRAIDFAAETLKDDPEVLKCVSLPGTKIGA